MISAKYLWCVFLLCFLGTTVQSLDEESVKEKKCFEPDVSSVELDYEWVFSNSRWYFTMMSKLDLYRTAWDTLKKETGSISPEEVETPCIYADWEGFTPSVVGFGGKTLEYAFTPNFDNTFNFAASWRKGTGGKMYLVKTDNKNYLLFVKCWDHDEEVSWNVMSISKTLEDEQKKEIYSVLESLGLSKGNVVEQKFDTCKMNEPVKSEL